MTVSYSWLSEYIPEKLDPETLSNILTSIGLEVESLEKFDSIQGGLNGLFIGEVLTCVNHENSDHLHVTTVNLGQEEPVQIVCGAPNVAAGQKVIVATVGATIYPITGDPLTMKKAKIRGVESFGMICAADEIGVGESHDGIMVLPANVIPGTPASQYFNVHSDFVYEIGLTANRMDAMSHIGTARDVCAYLSFHNGVATHVNLPATAEFAVDNHTNPFTITIENQEACPRYAGVSISGVTIAPSPEWLQNKLNAIGVRPINNVVDITNFVLHEFGQPLHAFDADKIANKHIIVKNLSAGQSFTTLDGKERKLQGDDLMICDENGGLCIAGVFGGAESGITDASTNVFLESAFFHPTTIRKTSMHHGLRTDAATHFEKGVDISNTITALKRAAILITSIAGGQMSSDIIDIYPTPKEKKSVTLTYDYLKKLSGKVYETANVKRILLALGFEITEETEMALTMLIPFSKPDISIPADIVEEIIRIDGLDNIEIPSTILISPQVDDLGAKLDIFEKTAQFLVGQGFNEILTNSITNSAYYDETTIDSSVKMLNSLNSGLDVMRPSLLETGLEVIAYNANRRINNLRLFEIGKSYHTSGVGQYTEIEHLSIFLTGKTKEDDYISKGKNLDFFTAKSLVEALLQLHGFTKFAFKPLEGVAGLSIEANKKAIGSIRMLPKSKTKTFDIKADICYIDIEMDALVQFVSNNKITYTEVPKFPAVSRDLALVLDRSISFDQIEKVIKQANLNNLIQTRLFDIFENDKLGENKKSMGINFTFQDNNKTLVDKEIDAIMAKLIKSFEKSLNAEIRK